jgi:hypothetical protein
MLMLQKKKKAADFAEVRKCDALRLSLEFNNSFDTAGLLYSGSTLFEPGAHKYADYYVCAAEQRCAAGGKKCKSQT